MKMYQTKSALVRKIKQTILQYMEYSVVVVDGKFTAKFVCLSDLEKNVVTKEGFLL